MKSENLQLSRLPTRDLVIGTLHNLQEILTSWQRRARERSELAQLDPWTQRDLGLSDSELEQEANKPRWQA